MEFILATAITLFAPVSAYSAYFGYLETSKYLDVLRRITKDSKKPEALEELLNYDAPQEDVYINTADVQFSINPKKVQEQLKAECAYLLNLSAVRNRFNINKSANFEPSSYALAFFWDKSNVKSVLGGLCVFLPFSSDGNFLRGFYCSLGTSILMKISHRLGSYLSVYNFLRKNPALAPNI